MKKGFGDGSKLYQRRAKEALPRLVARAKAGRTVTYGQLAKEMQMPNARNLNYVLGAVGQELQLLSKQWHETVPPIQCIVINKANKFPGRGIGFHLPYQAFQKLTPLAKEQVLKSLHIDIWGYARWDDVLKHYGITPVIPATLLAPLVTQARYGKAGGEGEDHRRLKEFLGVHPELLKISANALVQAEYAFPSGDRIDLLFREGTTWTGVEVKGSTSDDADLLRGIFQCVKYRALIDADQRFGQHAVDSRVVLAIGGVLSPLLAALADLFNIEVRQQIVVPQGSLAQKRRKGMQLCDS